MAITIQHIRSLPKVELHTHLDGGLRPETIAALAREIGYTDLPTLDPEALKAFFIRGANTGNLKDYLSGFAYTTALMQTKEALERVAYELGEDMALDGVCYAEVRFSPALHTQEGLHWDEILQSVINGFQRVEQKYPIVIRLIVCALRHMESFHSEDMAHLAVDFRDKGVVGFDLAGEEGGYPPKKHIHAFQFCQRENFNITIHAGEAFGKESIWQALQWCGAHRIGHATRLIDDFVVGESSMFQKGSLSQYILDKRIPLEICLSSNVHTGAVESLEKHPFKVFFSEKFRVCLNTDNRLMSNTTLTDEYYLAHSKYDLSCNDLQRITINAMKSAFISYGKRCDIIYNVIKPAYSKYLNTFC